MKPWDGARRRWAEQRDSRKAADHANSPEGLASAARLRGDTVLQIEISISEFNAVPGGDRSTNGGPTDIIGRVEAIGWRFDRVGYVMSGSDATVHGIYLFRNVDRLPASTRPRPRSAPVSASDGSLDEQAPIP